ncbi:MAG TPA: UDP-glucose 4-epimerase GalE, partial [Pseudomonas sp.]|nr:UDP-glucose 4-epimerase GalE [Pseudomonas sp.]
YPTPDGTGIRDYIHVVDLVKGHLKALERLNLVHGAQVWNLGAGKGHSVREMITAFEEVTGRPLPHVIKPRRAGDIAQCWSDPSKAERELGWRAEKDLITMLADAWRWQSRNPRGYAADKVAAADAETTQTALAS